MFVIKKNIVILAAFTSSILCGQVYADGLSDLKQALSRLQGKSEVSASFELVTFEKRDEEEKNGQIKIHLKEDMTGLQITHDQKVLDQLDLESKNKDENEDAKTPTLNAINRLSTSSLRGALSASSHLERRINKATFLGEKNELYQGQSVRLLSFDMPVEAIIDDKKVRGYVNKFEGTYQVLIADDGTPLEIAMTFKGKGSAFVFFTLKASGTSISKYQVINGRLINVFKEYKNKNSSVFGDYELTGTEVIDLLDGNNIAG
jgi:hypothetical protein